MIHGNVAFKLNGTTNLSIGGDQYQWDQRWLGYMDIWSNDAGKAYTVTINLTGSDWEMSTLRLAGSAIGKITMSDASTAGVAIENLMLQGSGGSSVTLTNARIANIFGGAGADLVTLGVEGARTVHLRNGNNVVTTGTGFVESIIAGTGTDKVNATGGVASIFTGAGNDTVRSNAGHIGRVDTGDGNDVVVFGTGNVASTSTGDGNDKVTTGSGWSGVIGTSNGDDTVNLGSGTADVVDVGDGNDTINVNGGWVGAINAYGGDTKVVFTGNGKAGSLALGGGNNVVTTGNGSVQSIVALDGNDTINIGAGGANSIAVGDGSNVVVTKGWVGSIIAFGGNDKVTLGVKGADIISLGGGNDTIKLSMLASKVQEVHVAGGGGVDTVNFSSFSTALKVSLKTTAETITDAGTFILSSVENIIGGSAGDTLIGSGINNALRGFIGSDKLTGSGGNDVFVYKTASESTVATSGRDTIFDFDTGDRIDLAAMDANSKISGNQAFKFITTGFSGAGGELRADKQTSDTFIFGDIDGDKQADFAIHLDDALTLNASFFML